MASKTDQIYYENLIEAAEYSCQAAEYLTECLQTYNRNSLEKMLQAMHTIEHTADKKKHDMSALLAKAFVTPLDREDLAALSQEIDNVTDYLEEVLQRFYVDELQTVPEEAFRFAEKLGECCNRMLDMLRELNQFKKPERLRSLIIRVCDSEEECDKIYLEITRNAKQQFSDPLEILAWRRVYDTMESCADACSHVADLVEFVVMKNT